MQEQLKYAASGVADVKIVHTPNRHLAK